MLAQQRFTAQGRKAQLCKTCEKLPKAQRQSAAALDELAGFVAQANLSGQNIARLKVLSKSEDATVRSRAQVLLEVAQVHPHKRKRIAYLREKHPALLEAYVANFGAQEEDLP